jgi:uncharacterized RDD family membrane protein YckC
MTMAASAALDTVRRVATPEGCEIGLRVAGPVTRARAWLFDFLLRMVGWMLLGAIAGYIGRLGAAVFMVGAFLIEWFYPILFEVYMRGQTPGKRACGLVVLHDDGRPVGWQASFLRNTVRFIDFLPFLYATGFLTTLLNADGKRLGDLAAGTVVAHIDSRDGKDSLEQIAGELGAEPPPMPLTAAEQKAVIEYGRRAGQLTEERAAELAEIAAPLVGDLPPDQARLRLLRVANFLLGSR